MSANWHYEKQGRAYGPVPWEHLQALLQTGQLSADDVAWTDAAGQHRVSIEQAVAMGPLGVPSPAQPQIFAPDAAAMDQGVADHGIGDLGTAGPASAGAQANGAVPGSNQPGASFTADPGARPGTKAEASGAAGNSQNCGSDSKASAWDTCCDKLRQGGDWVKTQAAAVAANAKDTAELTRLSARGARIRRLTLPAAYLALGRHVRREKAFRDDFPELHGKLDELAARMKQLHAVDSPDDEFPSLTDRATGAAARVGAFAKAEVVVRKARHLLRELGRAAYEKHGLAAGPETLTQPIAQALATLATTDPRADELKSRLARLVTPQRVAIGAVAVAVAAGAVMAAVAPGTVLGGRFGR